ncbi:MAG: hypothetical protein C0616_09850 [Desulfuromonas sp.]|nr:MAG: hypothetical protein C0616_09850 [Desulfuromonas sp.]
MIRCISLLCCLVFLGACVPVQDPESDAEAHYIMGVSYLQEGNDTSALRELLAAIKVNDRISKYHHALAQAYQRKKGFPQAETHYLKALELAEVAPEIHNNLASLYLDQGRWDDAIRNFDVAARDLLFDRPEVAFAGKGFAHFQKGEYAAALEAFQEAQETNPNYPPIYLYSGNANFALNRPDQAVTDYRKGISLAPGYTEAYLRLGIVLLRQQEIEAARESFEKVLELAPQSLFANQAREQLDLIH